MNKMKCLKPLLIGLIFTISIYLINKLEFSRGGLGNSPNFLKIDLPIILIIFFNIKIVLKNNIISFFLIYTPIILFYLFFNEYYIFFNRIFRISELNEISEIISVLSWNYLLFLCLCVFFYLFLFIKNITFNKLKKYYLISVVSLIVLLSFIGKPSIYHNIYNNLGFKYVHWDLKRTARENSFINHILYDEFERIKVLNSLNSYSDSLLDLKIDFNRKTNKNIHLIVLESFFNPETLSEIKFSKSPIHPEFKKFFQHSNHIISPVYGGGTAQAEFELLTSTPAKKEFSSIEFNVFTGAKTYSLPFVLNQLEYKTIATNGYKPYIFNSSNAYKGLGFNEQHYINRSSYLSKNPEDLYIPDNDLLSQNLNYIQDTFFKKNKQPIFNYIMGMYGHYPFIIDYNKTPKVIKATYKGKEVGEEMTNYCNQIYYRTKGVAKYISNLLKIDPESLIIVLGDHLPPITNIKKYGCENIYQNNFFMLDSGHEIKFKDTINFYNLPQEILKRINNSTLNDVNKDDLYKTIIYQASK